MEYFRSKGTGMISTLIGIFAIICGGFVTLAIATFGRRYGDRGVTTLLIPLVPLYILTFAEVVRGAAFLSEAYRPIAVRAESIEIVVRIVLAYGWVHACHQLLRHCAIVDVRQRLTPAFAVLAGAATLLYVISMSFPLQFDVSRLVSLEVGVSLVYAALCAIFSFWRGAVTLPSARLAVLIAGVSMIVYPLVSLADIFGFSYPGMIPGVPIWMQTQPEYYAIVVTILFVFVVRRLIHTAKAPMPVDLDAFDLTDRERETVSRLLRGDSYKSISFSLGISIATVKTHINKAYAKLGVKSRSELQAGMARTPPRSRSSSPTA